jgi:NADH-quinone oxidoreductase subunit L
MGGLSRSMPFTRNVFILGAMALAGIPVMNGFWSKELILETGHVHGPLWAYVTMICVTGLTALYSLRMTALVFFGNAVSEGSAAGRMMRFSMGILAAGVLMSWLIIGPFSTEMAITLQQYPIQTHTLRTLLDGIVFSIIPWLILIFSVVIASLWMVRHSLTPVMYATKRIQPLLNSDFGFSRINSLISETVVTAGSVLARLHNGIVSWNLAATVTALLLIVIWCVGRITL